MCISKIVSKEGYKENLFASLILLRRVLKAVVPITEEQNFLKIVLLVSIFGTVFVFKFIIYIPINTPLKAELQPSVVDPLVFRKLTFHRLAAFLLQNAYLCGVGQCFSTAGPQPGTEPWHQLYRAARGLRKLQYATRFHCPT